MADKAKSAKKLLAEHELIGFTRVVGDQAIRRASSAKVTEPQAYSDLAKDASRKGPADTSGS